MMKIYAVVAAGAVALAGCTQSSLRINNDFGQAVRQDLAAQIADPDAHYAGTVAPGGGGARVELAQRRYELNKVIQPSRAGAAQLSPTSNQTNSSSNNDVTTPGTETGSAGGNQ